jgi:hypothetical protein
MAGISITQSLIMLSVLFAPIFFIVTTVLSDKYKQKRFLKRIKPGSKLGWINTSYHRGDPFGDFYDKKYISYIIVNEIKKNKKGDVYIQWKYDIGVDETLYSSNLKCIVNWYDIVEE